MSGGASKSKSKSQSTQSSESFPWIGQQPFLTDVFQGAQGLYNQGLPGFYPGDTFVPFNAVEQGAMDRTMQRGD